MNRNSFSLIMIAIAAMTFVGCGKSQPTDASNTTPDNGADRSDSWLLASMPADAKPVSEAKKSAKEGERIAMRGRIGGRPDPFTKGAAAFVMMDMKVPHCAEKGDDDHCRTPWDYCCEPRDSMIANSATVQIVDQNGTPIQLDLRSFGLKPLEEIIVVGTVGPRPSEQVLVISATGLHRIGG